MSKRKWRLQHILDKPASALDASRIVVVKAHGYVLFDELAESLDRFDVVSCVYVAKNLAPEVVSTELSLQLDDLLARYLCRYILEGVEGDSNGNLIEIFDLLLIVSELSFHFFDGLIRVVCYADDEILGVF